MKKLNPVVHFEIPADNKDRMVDFYIKVFGWEAQKLGPEMGNYVVVSTTETDESGRPKNPGAINGGFFDRSQESQHITIVIAVDDIRASMKSVEEAGGKIIGGGKKAGEPDEIPGVGLNIAFTDTEGNRLALLQPKTNM